jgi:hypothetical protein
MKTLLTLALVAISASLHAQSYSFRIQEDYNESYSTMFNEADEFQINSIENGMYVSKAARMHAQIDFPYALYDRQKRCIENSDMEYTIVKIKGDKESFICVQIDPTGDKNYPYLVFQYNELGDWKLTNYQQDKTYSSGKTTVNPGVTPNVIKIEHRYSKIRYSVNGELATEFNAENSLVTRWYNNKIYSKNKKFVIGLDNVVLTGCISEQVVTVKKEIPAEEMPSPPDPNEIVDYAKIYDPKPDTDIIFFRNKDELWGAKNLKGELLFAPKFDYLPDFYDGVTFVYNGRAALVDRTGKELTPYHFYDVKNFSEGVALVSICDENGEKCKHSYIDKTGKEVLALPEKYTSAGSFYDGLAVVTVGSDDEGYTYGYIDKTGKEVIPPTFEEAGDFRYNRAPISVKYKIGYINKTGKIVIPPKYYQMGRMAENNFIEGLSSLYIEDEKSTLHNRTFKHGFIDVNGKEVIPLQYTSVRDFVDGIAIVFNDKKYGFIDKNGKQVTPIKYDNYNQYTNSFSEGLAAVSVNDKSGFIDKNGTEVIPVTYRKVIPFADGIAGVLSCPTKYVDETCKWGFIDKTGKTIVTHQYSGVDEIFGFSEGLIAVANCITVDYKDKCKYGFMNKTGKLIIPLKYDYAEPFAGGLANVVLNGEELKVDLKGTEIRGGKKPQSDY